MAKETPSERRARWHAEPKDPDDPRHGRVGFYNNHGCRCERCTNANRTKTQADIAMRRKSRARFNPDDPRHGTEYFYMAYNCKCDRCREGARLARKKREQNG